MLFDKAQILFFHSFKITDKISVRHSTIGDIIRYGEDRYFGALSTLVSIPSDAKSLLADIGLDWVEVPDLEYFAMVTKTLPREESEIFLPGIDFSKFKMYVRPDGDKLYADSENGIVIDMGVHMKIQQILCTIHRIKKKPESFRAFKIVFQQVNCKHPDWPFPIYHKWMQPILPLEQTL